MNACRLAGLSSVRPSFATRQPRCSTRWRQREGWESLHTSPVIVRRTPAFGTETSPPNANAAQLVPKPCGTREAKQPVGNWEAYYNSNRRLDIFECMVPVSKMHFWDVTLMGLCFGRPTLAEGLGIFSVFTRPKPGIGAPTSDYARERVSAFCRFQTPLSERQWVLLSWLCFCFASRPFEKTPS